MAYAAAGLVVALVVGLVGWAYYQALLSVAGLVLLAGEVVFEFLPPILAVAGHCLLAAIECLFAAVLPVRLAADCLAIFALFSYRSFPGFLK